LLVNATDPQVARGFVEEIEVASRKLNLTTRPVEIRVPDDIDLFPEEDDPNSFDRSTLIVSDSPSALSCRLRAVRGAAAPGHPKTASWPRPVHDQDATKA